MTFRYVGELGQKLEGNLQRAQQAVNAVARVLVQQCINEIGHRGGLGQAYRIQKLGDGTIVKAIVLQNIRGMQPIVRVEVFAPTPGGRKEVIIEPMIGMYIRGLYSNGVDFVRLILKQSFYELDTGPTPPEVVLTTNMNSLNSKFGSKFTKDFFILEPDTLDDWDSYANNHYHRDVESGLASFFASYDPDNEIHNIGSGFCVCIGGMIAVYGFGWDSRVCCKPAIYDKSLYIVRYPRWTLSGEDNNIRLYIVPLSALPIHKDDLLGFEVHSQSIPSLSVDYPSNSINITACVWRSSTPEVVFMIQNKGSNVEKLSGVDNDVSYGVSHTKVAAYVMQVKTEEDRTFLDIVDSYTTEDRVGIDRYLVFKHTAHYLMHDYDREVFNYINLPVMSHNFEYNLTVSISDTSTSPLICSVGYDDNDELIVLAAVSSVTLRSGSAIGYERSTASVSLTPHIELSYTAEQLGKPYEKYTCWVELVSSSIWEQCRLFYSAAYDAYVDIIPLTANGSSYRASTTSKWVAYSSDIASSPYFGTTGQLYKDRYESRENIYMQRQITVNGAQDLHYVNKSIAQKDYFYPLEPFPETKPYPDNPPFEWSLNGKVHIAVLEVPEGEDPGAYYSPETDFEFTELYNNTNTEGYIYSIIGSDWGYDYVDHVYGMDIFKNKTNKGKSLLCCIDNDYLNKSVVVCNDNGNSFEVLNKANLDVLGAF